MGIQNNYDEKGGKFFIEENGEIIAEMTYVFAGEDKFIIDHTEVFPAGEGKGLGKKLVSAAVDFARDQKMKIMPLCPFAKSVIEKTVAYHDVLF